MTLTRREALRLAAGAGMAAAVGALEPVLGGRGAAQERPVNQVRIPSSGRRLPHIGIGCRNYRGALDSDEMPAFRATLETFHRLGGRVLDTSPNYGNSEEIVGRIMRELRIRDEMFVATKVDRRDRESGVERMERSFERLGGDDFELMQVHNLVGVEVQLETMKAWKDQGRFRHIGVTTSSERQYGELEAVMGRHRLDFIQVDYSLGNRSAAERLIPLAADSGVAVLVNLPFGRGRLFSAVGDRPLPDWATEIGARSWAQVFLKYLMSAQGVVIPIPGTTKPHHAEDNVAAAVGPLPDAALRREMERFIDPLL